MMKLLLVDGNAVLHRAYYAMPDWRNRSGEATAGVYGFLSMTLKALEELKPTHLVIVFDTPAPTFRHEMYVGYQSNREKDRQVSEDIWGQVDKLKVVFEKAGVAVFSVEGFEADDVLGTLAKQAEEGGATEVIIITGDRDLMQLVNEKTKLYMPQKGLTDGMLIDEQKVVERMGVRPDQIIDYKGLVGDASDNYPGVTGIGPKTATTLLAEYGNVERIYSKLDQLADKVRMKLLNGYEAAMLSLKLATIRLDAPATLNWGEAIVPKEEKILSVLKELGYRSLIRRVSGEVVEEDENQQKLFE